MKELSKCPFKEGDTVKVTEAGLKWGVMNPARLVKEGKPNKFHVINVKNWDKGIYPQGTISLAECCGRAIDETATCTGHPAQYFLRI